MAFHNEQFDPGDLVKVEPPERPVVHKAGSTIMNLDCVDSDGTAHCSYEDDEGQMQFVTLPLVCLYSCTPIVMVQYEYRQIDDRAG